MKYTVCGLQQSKLVSLGLSVTDSLILSVLRDRYASMTMQSEIIDNQRYVWLSYENFLMDLPIVFNNDNIESSKRLVSKKLKQYEDLGLIKRKIMYSKFDPIKKKMVKGTYSYFRLTNSYDILLEYEKTSSDSSNMQEKEAVEQQFKGGANSHSRGGRIAIPTKDASTRDYPTRDNTTTTESTHNEEIITNCKDDVVVEPVIVDTSKDLKPIIKAVTDKPIIKATTEDRSYLNLFRANFKVKYKAVLDEFKLKEVFIDKGKKVLDYYMEHLQEFMDSSTRKIESIAAYFIAAVQREYVLPVGYSGNGQRKSTGTPPIQSTNYTQREYSDEFFDSLYANAHLL